MDGETRKLKPYQAAWWLQRLVVAYRRFLSPVLGRRCIYLPTCSEYAFDALGEWGAIRGTWMAMKRLGRCNPWRDGGYDPVPRRGASPSNLEPEAS